MVKFIQVALAALFTALSISMIGTSAYYMTSYMVFAAFWLVAGLGEYLVDFPLVLAAIATLIIVSTVVLAGWTIFTPALTLGPRAVILGCYGVAMVQFYRGTTYIDRRLHDRN